MILFWKLLVLFVFSMIKYLLAPYGGPVAKLNFIETYLACLAGAYASAVIFYFASGYFFKKAVEKQKAKFLATGFHKKKFTKVNKTIVKIKRSAGIWGIGLLAPFFLSVPLGSIIVAKFFGHQKITFPIILIGLAAMGFLNTLLAYTIFK